MDLSQLAVSELRILLEQVQQTGKSSEQDELVRAREKILAIAHGAGVSLKELFAAPSSLKHRSAVIKTAVR
jgi:DNA-binding protein H-NS